VKRPGARRAVGGAKREIAAREGVLGRVERHGTGRKRPAYIIFGYSTRGSVPRGRLMALRAESAARIRHGLARSGAVSEWDSRGGEPARGSHSTDRNASWASTARIVRVRRKTAVCLERDGLIRASRASSCEGQAERMRSAGCPPHDFGDRRTGPLGVEDQHARAAVRASEFRLVRVGRPVAGLPSLVKPEAERREPPGSRCGGEGAPFQDVPRRTPAREGRPSPPGIRGSRRGRRRIRVSRTGRLDDRLTKPRHVRNGIR